MRKPAAFSILVAFSLSPVALAQHAETVLFGDPSAAGLALPPERKAVHPLTAPYYNEDAFVTSDLRLWHVRHSFPNSSLIDGGDANVTALQIRAALTESLQFVAYKDGYADFDTGLVDDSGLFDIGAGLKWAFLQDWETDTHAAVGLGYEIGAGDDEVLQDDEELRLWFSYNQGSGPWHYGLNVNYTAATGSEDDLGDSDRLSWHLHADYYVNEQFSPVVEINGYHTLDEGDNTPLPFSGLDVANLGGGDGEDAISIGLGGEYRPTSDIAIRAAWEGPLTDEEDLWGDRVTLSAIWSF